MTGRQSGLSRMRKGDFGAELDQNPNGRQMARWDQSPGARPSVCEFLESPPHSSLCASVQLARPWERIWAR
jgi:hypothetical protein